MAIWSGCAVAIATLYSLALSLSIGAWVFRGANWDRRMHEAGIEVVAQRVPRSVAFTSGEQSLASDIVGPRPKPVDAADLHVVQAAFYLMGLRPDRDELARVTRSIDARLRRGVRQQREGVEGLAFGPELRKRWARQRRKIDWALFRQGSLWFGPRWVVATAKRTGEAGGVGFAVGATAGMVVWVARSVFESFGRTQAPAAWLDIVGPSTLIFGVLGVTAALLWQCLVALLIIYSSRPLVAIKTASLYLTLLFLVASLLSVNLSGAMRDWQTLVDSFLDGDAGQVLVGVSGGAVLVAILGAIIWGSIGDALDRRKEMSSRLFALSAATLIGGGVLAVAALQLGWESIAIGLGLIALLSPMGLLLAGVSYIREHVQRWRFLTERGIFIRPRGFSIWLVWTWLVLVHSAIVVTTLSAPAYAAFTDWSDLPWTMQLFALWISLWVTGTLFILAIYIAGSSIGYMRETSAVHRRVVLGLALRDEAAAAEGGDASPVAGRSD